MISLPNTLISEAELPENVKKERIRCLLEMFYDYKEKAERAADQRRWILEASYCESIATTAETIFGLMGLTDAQTTSRTTTDRRPGQRTDGLEPVNDLRRRL